MNNSKKEQIVNTVLSYIKEKINLTLEQDDSLGGLKEFNERYFFSVDIKEPILKSLKAHKLYELAKDSKVITQVSESGYSRLAVSINIDEVESYANKKEVQRVFLLGGPLHGGDLPKTSKNLKTPTFKTKRRGKEFHGYYKRASCRSDIMRWVDA